MSNPKNAIRSQIEGLVEEINLLFNEELETHEKPDYTLQISTINRYSSWYSMAVLVVKSLLPERLLEFTSLYKNPRRAILNANSYTISDFFSGTRMDSLSTLKRHHNIFLHQINLQSQILQSSIRRLDSILSNIEGTLQAQLFDNELDAAKDLAAKGHIRAAGAICGVILESHFASVVKTRELKIKKNPTLVDYNDLLRNEGVYDIATWRLILRLGDIRNLCAHAKEREPSKDEVLELIDGTAKIIAIVF